jgi:nitrate reductase cytochrome c-type subunit
VYQDAGMTRIPASVTPNFRVPLFWLAFKNMPYLIFKNLVVQTLKKDGYVCLYCHPWEFSDAIGDTALPNYTKRWCGKILTDRLYKLVKDLKKEGEFITMQQFLQR